MVLALRSLRSHPSYALVVVATLALGIAANSLIFSFMNPYLIRELPFGHPDQLVQLGQVDPIHGWDGARFSLPQFEDWKERTRAFDALAAYYYGVKNVTGHEGPEQVMTGYLTANMFDVLEVEAALGRTFAPGEDGPGGADVVVLRHGLWQRRYGGDPGIVGQTILLDGIAHTVIGVMPPDFNFPFGGVRMWTPVREDPATEARDRDYFIPVGRLKASFSRERTQAELESIQSEFGELYPNADGQFKGVNVQPLRAALNFGYDIMVAVFTVLLVAVGFVLLIACVNVASLTMARSSARSRDVAVRAALGAGRGRLVRQLLTESFVLALAGGALGIAIAHSGVRYLGPLIPEDIFRIGEFTLDRTVLMYSVAITLATPVIFGLFPALGISRSSLVGALKPGARGSADSLKVRRALVIAEVAMAIVLIGGTGLMLRSFVELQKVDIGFDGNRVLTVLVTTPESDYPTQADSQNLFDRATAELRGIPGIEHVGLVQPLPMNHAIWSLQFSPPDQAPAAAEDWPVAHQFNASTDYFRAMRISLLAGRTFTDNDREDAPRVVIVSKSTAENTWPGQSPVGETLLVGGPKESVSAMVVGVVADVKHEGFDTTTSAQIYRPLLQRPLTGRYFVLSLSGSASAVAGPVREAFTRVDANLPLSIRPLSEIVAENTLQWSIGSLFLGVFGALALLLASLGIYGVIAYSVAQRRREIGIRMALGATGREIRSVIVGEGLRLTALGTAIGLVLALVVARLMSAVLFGVSPFDPVTFAAVAGIFAVTAVVASVLPASEAARTNPVVVLRYD